jgi:hypothetical protein
VLSGEPKIYVKTGRKRKQEATGVLPGMWNAYLRDSRRNRPKVYAIRLGSIRQRDQIVPPYAVVVSLRSAMVTHVGSIRKFEKQP